MPQLKSKRPLHRLAVRIGQAARPLDDLTRKIVEAHEENPTVHRHGEAPLPNMVMLDRVVEHLFEVIAPGYGTRQKLDLESATYHTGLHLDRMRSLLAAQIVHELRFKSPKLSPNSKRLKAEAQRLLEAFCTTIPELIRKLAEDLTAAFYKDPAAKSIELVLLAYPGIRAIRAYRIAHELHRLGLDLIARMISELAHSKTGIDIHPGATIGRRFFIDHGTGITIGETTIIGDDVILFQGVTIGARKFAHDEHGHALHEAVKRHPTIGDHVTVYANATILGADTHIGDYAVIGGSTWVTKSVAPYEIITTADQKLVSARNRLAPTVAAGSPNTFTLSDTDQLDLYIARIERCDDI